MKLLKQGLIFAFIIILSTCTDMVENYEEANNSSDGNGTEVTQYDYVFVIDGTGSMGSEFPRMKTSLLSFLDLIEDNSSSIRYSLVMFGNEPELVLDWTTEIDEVRTVINLLRASGESPGVHISHSDSVNDPMYEVIRMVLSEATENILNRDNCGGSGELGFRSDARKKIIVMTDEDSNEAYHVANRSTVLQECIDTANIIAVNDVDFYIFINENETDSILYLGSPDLQEQNSDYTDFDAAQTLQNIIDIATLNGVLANITQNFQYNILNAGALCRLNSIHDVDDVDLINNVLVQSLYD